MRVVKNNLYLLILLIMVSVQLLAQEWEPVGPKDHNWPSLGGVEYVDMAFASDGSPYISYKDYEFNEELTVAKYDLTTELWEIVGKRGISEDHVEFTSIVIGPNNVPYVAYADANFDDYLIIKYFNGFDWVEVGGGPLETKTKEMVINFDSSGTLYVAYQDQDSSGAISVQRFVDYKWEVVGSLQFTNTDTEDLSFEIDENDTLYIAYEIRRGIHLYTFDIYESTSWAQIDTSILPITTIGNPSMAITDGGVVFSVQDQENNDRLAVIYLDGTWKMLGDYLTSSNVGDSAIMAVEDAIVVVYSSDHDNNENTDYKTSVKFYENEDQWQLLGLAGFTFGEFKKPKIGYGSRGIFVVGADDKIEDFAAVYQYVFNEDTWHLIGEPGLSAAGARDIIAKYAADGNLYVAFSDESVQHRLSVKKYNKITQEWEFLGKQGFSESLVTDIDLEFDSKAIPYVSVREDNNATSVYFYNGTNWSYFGQNPVDEGSGFLHMHIDNYDNVYLAYQDYNNGGRLTAQKYNRAKKIWQIMSNLGLPSENINHTDIITNSKGTPYVVSSSYHKGNAKGLVWKYNEDTNSWNQLGTEAVTGNYPYSAVLQVDSKDQIYLSFKDNAAKVVRYNDKQNSWEPIGNSFPVDYQLSFQITNTDNMYLGYETNDMEKAAVRKYNSDTKLWEVVAEEGFSFARVSSISLAVFNDTEMTMLFENNFAWAKKYTKMGAKKNDRIEDILLISNSNTYTKGASELINLSFNAGAGNNYDLDWQVSNSAAMKTRFDSAALFNGNINSWNTNKVINIDLMSQGIPVFNQNLNNWKVSSVEDVGYKFPKTDKRIGDLASWGFVP